MTQKTEFLDRISRPWGTFSGTSTDIFCLIYLSKSLKPPCAFVSCYYNGDPPFSLLQLDIMQIKLIMLCVQTL